MSGYRNGGRAERKLQIPCKYYNNNNNNNVYNVGQIMGNNRETIDGGHGCFEDALQLTSRDVNNYFSRFYDY